MAYRDHGFRTDITSNSGRCYECGACISEHTYTSRESYEAAHHTFKLQLGTMEAEYRLYQTNAPVEADGFGTFTVTGSAPGADYPHGLRFVLVRVEHETWQIARYASGLWSREPEEIDHNIAGWITETLYKRMVGGAQ